MAAACKWAGMHAAAAGKAPWPAAHGRCCLKNVPCFVTLLVVVCWAAGLAALAAGLVRLASTAMAAITPHAAAAALTSPAHLNLLAWNTVCAQQGTVSASVAVVNCVLLAHSGPDLPRPLLTLVKEFRQQLQLKN